MNGFLERAESDLEGHDEIPGGSDRLLRENEQLRAQLGAVRNQLKLMQSRAMASERALAKADKRRRHRRGRRRGPGGTRP